MTTENSQKMEELLERKRKEDMERTQRVYNKMFGTPEERAAQEAEKRRVVAERNRAKLARTNTKQVLPTHPSTLEFPPVTQHVNTPMRKPYNSELSLEEWLHTPEENIADGKISTQFSQEIVYNEDEAYREAAPYRDNNGAAINKPLRPTEGTFHKTRFGASWRSRIFILFPACGLATMFLMHGFSIL